MQRILLIGLFGLCSMGGAQAQTLDQVPAHDTCETAVALKDDSHMEGVSAEYVWLRQHYPNHQKESQALIECDGKPTDEFELVDAQGNTVKVLFDLSDYWGKGF